MLCVLLQVSSHAVSGGVLGTDQSCSHNPKHPEGVRNPWTGVSHGPSYLLVQRGPRDCEARSPGPASFPVVGTLRSRVAIRAKLVCHMNPSRN